MMTNGELTSIKRLEGTDGAGEEQLGDEQLGHPLPIAVSDPSSFSRAQLGALGVQLDRIVYVGRAALEAVNADINVDDQVVFSRYGRESETMAVLEAHDRNDGELVELRLTQRQLPEGA